MNGEIFKEYALSRILYTCRSGVTAVIEIEFSGEDEHPPAFKNFTLKVQLVVKFPYSV